ncbi:hypothetical protein NHP21005_19680 (plasmid) [Helicobacter sp. NHP21005]|uniref:plasmid mobilization protein n=1 Tax=Helicobacter felistomachi TaxID=3040201 RepID=UPI0025748490|nr:hypothetical protein [Helicobacter sp. NHP21005]BEG58280.1 hypothetical protein NHP21005_19680 [Helicobacter sp. NHP21005]
MPRENKSLTLKVRFTPKELEQVKNKAQESGLDVSKYVRSSALNQKKERFTMSVSQARKALENSLKNTVQAHKKEQEQLAQNLTETIENTLKNILPHWHSDLKSTLNTSTNTMQQDWQKWQKQQEAQQQNWQQGLEEKVLLQIQGVRNLILEQEAKHKELLQSRKLWRISTIVLAVFLAIETATITFLVKTQSQEPQAQIQNSPHLQEGVNTKSSYTPQTQGQQTQTKQSTPNLQEQTQINKSFNPHSNNAKLQEQVNSKKLTACQRYEAMQRKEAGKKVAQTDRESNLMKFLYAECVLERGSEQPPQPPKDDISKELLQTAPDILKGLDGIPHQ